MIISKNINLTFLLLITFIAFASCKKSNDSDPTPTPPATSFKLATFTLNNSAAVTQFGTNNLPVIKISFNAPVNRSSVANGVTLTKNVGGASSNLTATYQNGDSVLLLQPSSPLSPITKYTVQTKNILLSNQSSPLTNSSSITFLTAMDSSDKFPVISDNALLDKIQQQTFRYFWDFGHPISGMARERNTSGDLVTTGGTGFGVMSIVTAVSRNFISRADGAARVLKIANFLTTNCTKYHGAFAHWVNGATGATIPFSTNDNGGDLVETSLLMEGLITARQYFSTADATEADLRSKINALYSAVEWNWYRQNAQNVLYWHWSSDKNFIINQQVSGWNEALIVYVLGASSPNTANRIPKIVYDNGWARNGNMKNGGTFFGYTLPLGPDNGGPLFFEHYSFLGINPTGLNDAYANYATQTTNHTKINYEYCRSNPKSWYGYSSSCWGLTASDIPDGYNANAPGNSDVGVISPTAAISSMPYTPAESMAALKFFYYKLGDKMWGDYGFYDAFKLSDPWFATSTLAIDQGPQIVMIENYRTQLLWNLFTSAPEVKAGMTALGFTAPYL